MPQVFAVVTCSAPQSFVGKTAALVTGVFKRLQYLGTVIESHMLLGSHDVGHFQLILGGIGTTLLVLVIAFIFAVWIGGFFRCEIVLLGGRIITDRPVF